MIINALERFKERRKEISGEMRLKHIEKKREHMREYRKKWEAEEAMKSKELPIDNK